MVTAVTKYVTEDGAIHDSEVAAIYHEQKAKRKTLANAIYQNISNGEYCTHDEVLTSFVELFTNKNTRNMIKQLIEITYD